MIDHVDRREQNTVVAVLADVGGLDMRGVLADRLSAVMAAYAITRDIDVIEIGRQPTVRRMTIIAGIPAGNMRRVFARGNCAIVTG